MKKKEKKKRKKKKTHRGDVVFVRIIKLGVK